MPELPEVETVRRGLLPLVGGRITSAAVYRERSVRHQVGGPEAFVGTLQDAVIDAVVRRGKFLWLPLQDQPEALVAHLGMSGQLLVTESSHPIQDDGFEPEPAGSHPHLRVRLGVELDAGEPVWVDFRDQRTFGYLTTDELVPTPDNAPGGKGTDAPLVPNRVSHIGRDILDPYLAISEIVANLNKKQSEIKRLLLDQTLVAGIGNIYADEALWRAEIHPLAKANTLSQLQLETILLKAKEVITEALAKGGTSFDQLYVNVNGESGSFSDSLAVYGQEGELCPKCGSEIQRISFMNRSSHFCPNCQIAG